MEASSRYFVLSYASWLAIGSIVSLVQAEEHMASIDSIHILKDFEVEKVYGVPREQGSWVAMCFDDRGRIYLSDQGPRLYRMTVPSPGKSHPSSVELVSDKWGFTQGMAFIHGSLYVVQHGDHSKEKFRPEVLLRIKDTDGDDQLDLAERLFEFPKVIGDAANWYEHSLHAIVPGPDGKSIYIISGDRNGLPCEKGRTPKHWNRDSWEHPSTKEPYSGGWVMRADLDGQNRETLCMGLRNSYDMAFNHQGDLFTYDSDLENDIGLPNYRPTAIRQVLSGADNGWGGRAGEMLWSWTPKWEDIQPPLRNIGPGSPTGVCFGYGTKFPSRYQNALYACDWSYGRMFAVHLTPQGASYSAEPELFLSAQGLPIADVAVSPLDGSLYFLTGGRGTQSALYRVTYNGQESTVPAPTEKLNDATANAQRIRRELELLHGNVDSAAISLAWPLLGHPDRSIRSAARTAIEWQPLSEWRERALNEMDSRTALQALLSLARSTDGDPTIQNDLLTALARFDFRKLSADEQCWYLRILTISASRHGMYSATETEKLLAKLEPSLPSNDRRVNEDIVAMCAALHSNTFLNAALGLLDASRTQEEQIVYAQALIASSQSPAFAPEIRERFFQIAIAKISQWKGGFTARAVRDRTIHSVSQMLNESQRNAFSEVISAATKPQSIIPTTARNFVKRWELQDLSGSLAKGLKQKRDLERGRKLFTETACIVCHSFQGEGGYGGPDLSSVAGRYSPADLLDNILNPSRVINEQYGLMKYSLQDGSTVVGRTVNMAGETVMVATNPNDPGGSEVRFSIHDLERSVPSAVSFMPDGLLNTLTEEEVLDLMAYLLNR